MKIKLQNAPGKHILKTVKEKDLAKGTEYIFGDKSGYYAGVYTGGPIHDPGYRIFTNEIVLLSGPISIYYYTKYNKK